jgi:hypothetical protein
MTNNNPTNPNITNYADRDADVRLELLVGRLSDLLVPARSLIDTLRQMVAADPLPTVTIPAEGLGPGVHPDPLVRRNVDAVMKQIDAQHRQRVEDYVFLMTLEMDLTKQLREMTTEVAALRAVDLSKRQ